MFGFSKGTSDVLYGVVIDISSGSIGVAIVASNPNETTPTTIFSHREPMRAAIKNATLKDRIRQMREALFTLSLTLSRDGLQALNTHDPHARIKKILVSCAAPWSYTVSRTVEYNGDTDIKITRALIEDLVQSAEQEVGAHLEERGINADLAFEIVERATVDVRVNDYIVHEPIGLKGSSVTLSHITGLIPRDVITTIEEVQDKILPDTRQFSHTLMLIVYCVLRDLFPKEKSYCAILITDESTEFGVIVNNTLMSSMHIPYGKTTLERDLIQKTGKNATDICSRMKVHAENTLSEIAGDEVDAYMQVYTEHIQNAFTEFFTDTKLPETLILVGEPGTSTLYIKEFEKMAKKISKNSVTIFPLNSNVVLQPNNVTTQDVYLTIISRFFHKLHGCGEIDTSE